MKKNIFDRMSDSYDNFHLKDSEITIGNDIISVSARLKLILGWSVFLLACILVYFLVDLPNGSDKEFTLKDKKGVLKESVDVNEEHDTIVPYEKDADANLNAFIGNYFNAITNCDIEALQNMVMDASEYKDVDTLKRKAEYITGYSNITVYTKEGLEDDTYVAFVVANLSIAGVNSSPYDIMTLYIVNGERGYLINNGTLSTDVQEYIEKVKGDEDIQKIYRSVEGQNNALKEKDASLQNFFAILNGEKVETSEENVSGETGTAGTESEESVDGASDESAESVDGASDESAESVDGASDESAELVDGAAEEVEESVDEVSGETVE